MQSFENNCELKFRDQNLRITRARTLLFRLLGGTSKPLTPQQIHQHLLAQGAGKIDLASVYRNLQVLKDLHLVHQVLPTGGFLACDHCDGHSQDTKENRHHVLLLCKECEGSEELNVPERIFSKLEKYIGQWAGFSSTETDLLFRGKCSGCSRS